MDPYWVEESAAPAQFSLISHLFLGWMDERRDLLEKVYDAAWSGDRQPGVDGKLPPVGNTVNIEAASWTAEYVAYRVA